MRLAICTYLGIMDEILSAIVAMPDLAPYEVNSVRSYEYELSTQIVYAVPVGACLGALLGCMHMSGFHPGP